MAKQSLLLVDGDVRSLRVLEVSLKKAGYNVTTAVNGRDALDKVQTAQPDLIISDTEMTEMDGFEFCESLKKRSEWSDIPFIFLTSQTAIEHKIRGLELGVADYLTKPIYIKEITTRVGLLLQRTEREKIEEQKDTRTKFAGHLSDMGVVDLIQTIEVSSKTGVIHVTTGDGRRAAIYFRNGKVIDAEAGHLTGEDAVYRLLTWNEGEFEAQFRNVRRKDVIEMSSQGLLMEGMRRLDEWGRHLEQLPSLESLFEVDAAELSERLPELPDTLNAILKLFDGRRSLMQIIDGSDYGDLECLEVISKLYFEGLIVEVQPLEEPEDEGHEDWLPADVESLPAVVGLPAGEETSVTAEDIDAAGVEVAPAPSIVDQAIGDAGAVPIEAAVEAAEQAIAAITNGVPEAIVDDSERETPPDGVAASKGNGVSDPGHGLIVSPEPASRQILDDEDLFPSDPTPIPSPAPSLGVDDATGPKPAISSQGADVASAAGEVEAPEDVPIHRTSRSIVTITPRKEDATVQAADAEVRADMASRAARDTAPSASKRAARDTAPSASKRAARDTAPSASKRAARDTAPSASKRAARDTAPSASKRAAASKPARRLRPIPGGDPASSRTARDTDDLSERNARAVATDSSSDVEDRGPRTTTALAFVAGTVAVVGIAIFLITRGGDEAEPTPTAGGGFDARAVVASAPADAAAPHPSAPVDAAVAVVKAPPDAAPVVKALSPDAALSPREQWKNLMAQARAAQKADNLDEALDLIDKAIQLRRAARAFRLKADILEDQGRRREALTTYDQAIKLAPTWGALWRSKGMLHWELTDYTGAKDALSKYLELKPNARDADEIRAIIGGL